MTVVTNLKNTFWLSARIVSYSNTQDSNTQSPHSKCSCIYNWITIPLIPPKTFSFSTTNPSMRSHQHIERTLPVSGLLLQWLAAVFLTSSIFLSQSLSCKLRMQYEWSIGERSWQLPEQCFYLQNTLCRSYFSIYYNRSICYLWFFFLMLFTASFCL